MLYTKLFCLSRDTKRPRLNGLALEKTEMKSPAIDDWPLPRFYLGFRSIYAGPPQFNL